MRPNVRHAAAMGDKVVTQTTGKHNAGRCELQLLQRGEDCLERRDRFAQHFWYGRGVQIESHVDPAMSQQILDGARMLVQGKQSSRVCVPQVMEAPTGYSRGLLELVECRQRVVLGHRTAA